MRYGSAASPPFAITPIKRRNWIAVIWSVYWPIPAQATLPSSAFDKSTVERAV